MTDAVDGGPGASPGWDASGYDERFGYVSRFGSGVVELAGVRAGERVLDLGCGTGTLLQQFHVNGAVASGIDGDPEMVRAARELLPELDIRVADGQDFTVPEPVDVVFSNAALHWMTRPDDVARCVVAALRPGGRFVAEMGGAGNVATIIDAVRAEGDRRAVPVASPWYFPTIGHQATVLEDAGLHVSLVEHFPRRTPLAGPDGVADWLRMFGARLLEGFAIADRDDVIAAAAARTREILLTPDGWIADYWRLRFVAEKPA